MAEEEQSMELEALEAILMDDLEGALLSQQQPGSIPALKAGALMAAAACRRGD